MRTIPASYYCLDLKPPHAHRKRATSVRFVHSVHFVNKQCHVLVVTNRSNIANSDLLIAEELSPLRFCLAWRSRAGEE